MKQSELRQIIREEIEKELSSNSKGMKVEDLKLYNKYKYINYQDGEFIYIGIDNYDYYCFLHKKEKYNTTSLTLKNYDINLDKIVKDLNLETFINYNGKYIKGYELYIYTKEDVEQYLKPL
jgi:hypothetical protein